MLVWTTANKKSPDGSIPPKIYILFDYCTALTLTGVPLRGKSNYCVGPSVRSKRVVSVCPTFWNIRGIYIISPMKSRPTFYVLLQTHCDGTLLMVFQLRRFCGGNSKCMRRSVRPIKICPSDPVTTRTTFQKLLIQ